MILVSIPSRKSVSAVSKAQWHFAWALRSVGNEVRCIVPTQRLESLLQVIVPNKIQEFIPACLFSSQFKDIEYEHLLVADWHSLLPGNSKSIPIFHGGYGLLLAFAKPTSTLGLIKTHLLWLLQRIAARKAPYVIAVSHQALLYLGAPNGHVVYNAVNLSEIYATDKETKDSAKVQYGLQGKNVVFMAGRLSPEKRLESVLSLPLLQDRVYLVSVPDQKSCNVLSAKCKSREDIFIITSPDGISTGLWNIVDILFMPSLFEGCSLLWIEAAARSIPIVSTKVGHIIELSAIYPWLDELMVDNKTLSNAADKLDYAFKNLDKLKPLFRYLAETHHDLHVVGEKLSLLLNTGQKA